MRSQRSSFGDEILYAIYIFLKKRVIICEIISSYVQIVFWYCASIVTYWSHFFYYDKSQNDKRCSCESFLPFEWATNLRTYVTYTRLVHTLQVRKAVLIEFALLIHIEKSFPDQRLVHVVWDFCPWDTMTKVRYFLMVQIYNLRTLEVEYGSRDLPKTLIYMNFDPMGVSRAQKLKIKH